MTLVLVIMLIAMLLGSSLVIREKTSPAYFRNFITPASDMVFVLGHFLTNLFILVFQLGILLGVAAYFFGDVLLEVLGQAALPMLLVISVFVLIGMLIGYIFKSEETAMLGTISVASLFLFFSSTILPLETLPGNLREIALYNPFVLSEALLKKIMLFKAEMISVIDPILTLLSYGLILAIAVYAAAKYNKLRVQ